MKSANGKPITKSIPRFTPVNISTILVLILCFVMPLTAIADDADQNPADKKGKIKSSVKIEVNGNHEFDGWDKNIKKNANQEKQKQRKLQNARQELLKQKLRHRREQMIKKKLEEQRKKECYNKRKQKMHQNMMDKIKEQIKQKKQRRMQGK